MQLGVFIPIGNNGWLISTTSPQYMPTFDLNRAIVEKAERFGFDFALSMIKLHGFGGSSQFWEHNLESFTLMAGLAAVTSRIQLFATCAVLALMFWLWIPIAKPIVWHVETSAGVAVLWALFVLGWMLMLISTFLIDHFELFGLRQVFAAVGKRAQPEPRLETPLLYRLVRHPLYAGMLLSLWAVPTMSVGRLLFAVGSSVYILIGIAFEERDLLAQFGARYRTYREQVGMLIPHPRWPWRRDDGDWAGSAARSRSTRT